MTSTPETGCLACTSTVSRLVPHGAVYRSVTLAVSAARQVSGLLELRTLETVYPARSSAESWFRHPGQGVRYDRVPVSARGSLSGTRARRPPRAKCPVCTRVGLAARGYLFGMLR